MTRYHQFNAMFPEEAKKIHQGNEEFGEIIWKAFARATFLHKFFPFSFTPNVITDKADSDDTIRGIDLDPDYPIASGKDLNK